MTLLGCNILRTLYLQHRTMGIRQAFSDTNWAIFELQENAQLRDNNWEPLPEPTAVVKEGEKLC